MTIFVAIDFETADRGRDSACAVGLVRVEGNAITQRFYALIRPPRSTFEFTHIHGICWNDVRDQPNFARVWPLMQEYIQGADFLVAHNAGFDQKVLYACCDSYGLAKPLQSFVCTVQLARKTWKLRPTKLNNVCEFLGIQLDHHHALSDAEACAQIAIAAYRNSPRAARVSSAEPEISARSSLDLPL
ncbi:3'-5' exonuclease [Lyngbya confervoides]|uniref:3'-5' exonuclease n=1 Tax=Lyngbya confervoides BDU141951 TaxID=1574623 RepID=A0ABD4T1L2_9CYAN|nr:3'-5' exonuclease [Lyngbya confervoides]MCM1982490.1 3'-5' exonuclease [Lyngbya confervoides BDU141951]